MGSGTYPGLIRGHKFKLQRPHLTLKYRGQFSLPEAEALNLLGLSLGFSLRI